MEVLPPISIWEQFGVVAVIALFVVLLSVLGYRGFVIFTKWIAEQETIRQEFAEKRDKKQEEFQAKESQEWRNLIDKISCDSGEQTKILSESLERLSSSQVGMLDTQKEILSILREHDNFVRNHPEGKNK